MVEKGKDSINKSNAYLLFCSSYFHPNALLFAIAITNTVLLKGGVHVHFDYGPCNTRFCERIIQSKLLVKTREHLVMGAFNPETN